MTRHITPDIDPHAGIQTLAAVEDHFEAVDTVASRFFGEHAEHIADICRLMADRFIRGGRLLVIGEGAAATDAQHVSVEFVHPVIVGKRALPAIALTSDVGVLTASAPGETGFGRMLKALGRSEDILLAIASNQLSSSAAEAIVDAQSRGLLTIGLCGPASGTRGTADEELHVPTADPLVAQEIQETSYHVLWELVHVFFEHQPPAGATGVPGDYELELYPYLFANGVAADRPDDIVQQVRASTLQKGRDICDLRRAARHALAPAIAEAARAAAGRVRSGGKLLAFGNGGSATDAQDASTDCMCPAVQGWRRLPALALTNDIGVVTAVTNDVGFEHVFARQVIAFGAPDDVAVGFTTSGTSSNVLRALDEARARGLMTIGFSGYDGGPLARSGVVDVCLTVPGDYVPRIQETHATIWHALLKAIHVELLA